SECRIIGDDCILHLEAKRKESQTHVTQGYFAVELCLELRLDQFTMTVRIGNDQYCDDSENDKSEGDAADKNNFFHDLPTSKTHYHAGSGPLPAPCRCGVQTSPSSLIEMSFFLGLMEIDSSFSAVGSLLDVN